MHERSGHKTMSIMSEAKAEQVLRYLAARIGTVDIKFYLETAGYTVQLLFNNTYWISLYKTLSCKCAPIHVKNKSYMLFLNHIFKLSKLGYVIETFFIRRLFLKPNEYSSLEELLIDADLGVQT